MPDATHRHRCATPDACDAPCKCACGAVLEPGETYESDGLWVWRLPDGTTQPFPDYGDHD